MKNQILLISLATLIGAAACKDEKNPNQATGWQDASYKNQNNPSNVNDAPRTNYFQSIETQYAEFERRLADWKNQLSNKVEPAKTELNQLIANLESKMIELRRSLDEWKRDTGTAWKDIQVRADNGIQNLRNEFQSASSRFQ